MKKKLYIITRNDLDIHYAAVQAGHGVAQWLINNPDQTWNNRTLIYLAVRDEYALTKAMIKLQYKDVKISTFHEPDLNNELTSVTAYAEESYFKNYELLTS